MLGKRGTVAAVRWRTGADGGAPRGGDGVPVVGGQESSGEIARKLPRGGVVLVVCLAEVRGSGSSGRRRGGAAAEARAHRRSGPVDLAQDSKIGWAWEHQWLAAMLLEYWIEGGD
jgi:hypothetical protein